MEIIKISSLSSIEDFLNFCKKSSLEKDKLASVNMWSEDWENSKNTLPYILFKTDRFKNSNGEFHLAVDNNNNIIGCSGVYISDFSKEIAIAGCRTWILKEYRNMHIPRDFLLPFNKEWALNQSCKVIALTFNDYNKKLIDSWKRIRFGEKRTSREEKHLFFKNFKEVPFSVNIQYTKQWLVYEEIDKLNFDWNLIKFNEDQSS
jgi:hypothetical protein